MSNAKYGRNFGYKKSNFGKDLAGHTVQAFGDTTGKYFKWTASTNTFDIQGTLTATGNTTLTGNLTITGTFTGGSSSNIAINTNKFTVTASSGATLIAGLLTAQAGIKLTASASTTEGVIWYDSAAKVLKYRDDVGTKTITAS